MAADNYISLLSPHLFWDVDVSEVDVLRHKEFIISRVMTYGTMNDWRIICRYIGLKEIGNVAKNIRDLDPKSCSFLSIMTNIPLEEFRCYTLNQSNPPHWNF